MIIDSHVHVGEDKDKLKELLEACDKLGIDKVCALCSYKTSKMLMSEARDRIIPVIQVDVDREQSSFVHFLAEQGAKGLKIIRPPSDMTTSGTTASTRRPPSMGCRSCSTQASCRRMEKSKSEYMRPIHLDHLARTFHDLTLIMAHMGNPWWVEAGMAIRQNGNLYFDLSGSSMKKRPPEYFRSLLWWDEPDHPYQPDGGKHPFDKLLFATDVAPKWMGVWNDYQNLMDGMNVPEEYRKKIMGDTAAELYKVS